MSHKLIWTWLLSYVASIGLAIAALVYAGLAAQSAREDANRAIRENEKTQCIAYNIIHEQQQGTQPTTQGAKDFRDAVEQIRTRFKCEENEK